jgi:hypothetical protein
LTTNENATLKSWNNNLQNFLEFHLPRSLLPPPGGQARREDKSFFQKVVFIDLGSDKNQLLKIKKINPLHNEHKNPNHIRVVHF